MTLLERYKSGEYKAVWEEMVAGVDRSGFPIDPADADDVANETMRRARRNIETLVQRLLETGYEFGVYPDGEPIPGESEPISSVHSNIEQQLETLSAEVGNIPLSLAAFWRTVGGVCLAGRYSDADEYDYPDPLWIAPLDLEYCLERLADWKTDRKEFGDEEPFLLELAPDYFHKANVSGGPAYGIELPANGADAAFANEWHHTTFVNYLRICFEWGGFPGYARRWDGEHWVLEDEAPPHLAALCKGLLPI